MDHALRLLELRDDVLKLPVQNYPVSHNDRRIEDLLPGWLYDAREYLKEGPANDIETVRKRMAEFDEHIGHVEKVWANACETFLARYNR